MARPRDYTPTIVPRELPRFVRVWVYRSLLKLVHNNATDEGLREARGLLTAPAITGCLTSGTPRGVALTEAEIITRLEGIGEHVSRRVLRKYGRND
jgi:hypothetical protein